MANPNGNVQNFQPKKPPVFDPNERYGEVGGIEGVGYIQGKNYFSPNKQFRREAPEDQWMRAFTAEEKLNLRKQVAKNVKFFGTKKNVAPAKIPESVIKAEQENAQARAAEVYAA